MGLSPPVQKKGDPLENPLTNTMRTMASFALSARDAIVSEPLLVNIVRRSLMKFPRGHVVMYSIRIIFGFII